ncbi:ferritin-like domain-containing protein [bacterium]|nr:MAG: ferritin-like domain-containing protein [bacterium]
MKSEIIVPQTEIVTPEALAAEPKHTGQTTWGRHASAVLGALGIASLLKPAAAQDTPMPPAPTADQATPGNSAVPSTSSNPNNPAESIPKGAKSASPSDIDILNFALGLEYLEADFYARIVSAQQTRAYLNDKEFMAAQKLAADEAAHVTAITDLITRANGTPVAKQAFNFPAEAFFSRSAFLLTARDLEETGVGAYLGAAPKVDATNVLKFAASVYGIECRHASLIRKLAGMPFAPTETEVPLSIEEVQKRVAPFMGMAM